jgi:hypothetical protein
MVFAFPHAPTSHPLMPSFTWQNAVSAETIIPKHPSPSRGPLGFSAQGPTGAPTTDSCIISGRTLFNGPVSADSSRGEFGYWLTGDRLPPSQKIWHEGSDVEDRSSAELAPVWGLHRPASAPLLGLGARGHAFTAVDVRSSAGASVVE